MQLNWRLAFVVYRLMPSKLMSVTIVCNVEFKSSVKIYNELEFKEINYEIKNALIYKKIAKITLPKY